MLGAFATFLKKGSTKNFTEDKVLIYIVRSTVEHTMFALHQSVKVLVKLFQKLAGGWGEQPHNYGVFFLPSFFFAPLVPKKKRDCEVLCFLGEGRTLLSRRGLPPQKKHYIFNASVAA